MYETVHTGVPVSIHGVTSNQVFRHSRMPNLFELVVQAGKTTAAAAYYWVSELYNTAPYDHIDDKEVDDHALPIQHGRFYTEDDMPDVELYATAALLVRRFSPDYLLVHPMGMDHMGHTHGADSSYYRNQAIRQDMILAVLIPERLERGYTVLVTGDHGINADHAHGGNSPEMREVPLFLIQSGVNGLGDTGEVLSQLQIAPTILKLLGLPVPETMKHFPVV